MIDTPFSPTLKPEEPKNSSAAEAGLKINYAVKSIINPALKAQYASTSYEVKHRIGIDTSTLHVARVGVRNDNDLVWVGRAANYAAKLCAISENDTVFLTEEVFNKLSKDAKYSSNSGNPIMWRERKWTQMSDKRIYSSAWTWTF